VGIDSRFEKTGSERPFIHPNAAVQTQRMAPISETADGSIILNGSQGVGKAS
jgi:hypothetical protein